MLTISFLKVDLVSKVSHLQKNSEHVTIKDFQFKRV